MHAHDLGGELQHRVALLVEGCRLPRKRSRAVERPAANLDRSIHDNGDLEILVWPGKPM